MNTYRVELRRRHFTTLTVEAQAPDAAFARRVAKRLARDPNVSWKPERQSPPAIISVEEVKGT